jgi:beta-glucanase (GH16 family)
MISSLRQRSASGLIALGLTAVGLFAGASGTTAASATTAPTCGGETVTAPNGTPMTCTFDDEFSSDTGDATALDTSKWMPQLTANSGYTTGPVGSRACYVDTPNNISVSGGFLNLTVRREARWFACKVGTRSFNTRYTAGMVSTYHLFSQTYGQFEVRAKLPDATVKGLQETLWLWPVDPTKYGAQPASGEIDFAEFYSQYPNNDIPYIHYNYTSSTTNTSTNTNVVTSYNCLINYGVFNTYAALWQPGTITLFVNGKTCLTDNYVPSGGLVSPQPFDQPFIIALTSALGVGTNALTSATPFPATTQVDYVRAWK